MSPRHTRKTFNVNGGITKRFQLKKSTKVFRKPSKQLPWTMDNERGQFQMFPFYNMLSDNVIEKREKEKNHSDI